MKSEKLISHAEAAKALNMTPCELQMHVDKINGPVWVQISKGRSAQLDRGSLTHRLWKLAKGG
jgi:hypothetical protein